MTPNLFHEYRPFMDLDHTRWFKAMNTQDTLTLDVLDGTPRREIPPTERNNPEMTEYFGPSSLPADDACPDLGPNMTAMNGPSHAPTGVERAVRNSPPPLGDVGDDVFFMTDPSMGSLAGDETYPEEMNPHVVAANFAPLPSATDSLLAERGKTHGSFSANALFGQILRDIFRDSIGWERATRVEREALDYIAGKLARILSGQPSYADHWADIAGYATLATDRGGM